MVGSNAKNAENAERAEKIFKFRHHRINKVIDFTVVACLLSFWFVPQESHDISTLIFYPNR